MSEPKRRRRGCLFWIGIVAACGVVALVVVDYVLRRYGEARLARLPADVAASGSSLDFESLAPPLVPDAENGAGLVIAGEALYKSESDVKKPDDDFDWMGASFEVELGRDRDPRHVAFVRRYVEANARPLEMAREAASRKTIRFAIDPGDCAIADDGTGAARHLTFVLRAHARIALIDGDAQAAFDDAAATLAIGAGVGGCPTLVHRLVGIAIAELPADAIRDALATAPPDAARRAALLAALDRWDAIPFSRTLEGERAFEYASVQRMRADPASAFGFLQPSWPDRIALRYVALVATWQLDFLEDAIVEARRPAWEWTLDRAPVRWQARMWYGLGDNLSRIIAKELEARAKLAVLRAAILRRTGDAGPLPADPFTGRPLLESVDASGARTIYSVGPDRADDHGGNDDISARVPR